MGFPHSCSPGTLRPRSPHGARSLEVLSLVHTAETSATSTTTNVVISRVLVWLTVTASLREGEPWARVTLAHQHGGAGREQPGGPLQWWAVSVLSARNTHSVPVAGRRRLWGSGWSKYSLLKCSEDMASPTNLPCSPPAAHTLTPSLCLTPWTPDKHFAVTPQLYKAFSFENKRRPDTGWVSLSRGKH